MIINFNCHLKHCLHQVGLCIVGGHFLNFWLIWENLDTVNGTICRKVILGCIRKPAKYELNSGSQRKRQQAAILQVSWFPVSALSSGPDFPQWRIVMCNGIYHCSRKQTQTETFFLLHICQYLRISSKVK